MQQAVDEVDRVEEVDMARFIQQLESHIAAQVRKTAPPKTPNGEVSIRLIVNQFLFLEKQSRLLKRTCEQFAQKWFFNLQPVSVLEDISDQRTTNNQSATFRCRIQINYPEISLTWYKGTQRLDHGHKYEMSSVGDLHCLKINNCNTSDEGNYRVVCGPHISNAKLAVAGKGTIFAHVYGECGISAVTQQVLASLNPGQDFILVSVFSDIFTDQC